MCLFVLAVPGVVVVVEVVVKSTRSVGFEVLLAKFDIHGLFGSIMRKNYRRIKAIC